MGCGGDHELFTYSATGRRTVSQCGGNKDQTDERRHKSMIAYLNATNHPHIATSLKDEVGLGETFDDATSKKYEGLLEKKWTSVIRLQKRVCRAAALKLDVMAC